MKCHSDAKRRASLKAKGTGLFKCSGICKNDHKCTRTIRTGEYCWQHQHQKKEEDKKDKPTIQLDRCAICLDDVTEKKDAGLECGHSFHLVCIKQLRNNLCPVCRRELKSKKLKSIDSKRMVQRKEKDRRERESTLGSISSSNGLMNNILSIGFNNPDFLLIISQDHNTSERIRTFTAQFYSAIVEMGSSR